MFQVNIITLDKISTLINNMKLTWKNGNQTSFSTTAQIIDEIRGIVASTLKGNPRQAKRFFEYIYNKMSIGKNILWNGV